MPLSSIRLLSLAVACSQLGLSGCAAVTAAAAAHPALIAAAVDAAPLVLAVGGIGALGIAGIAGYESETSEPGTLGALLRERQATAAAAAEAAMRAQSETKVAAALQAQRYAARARVAHRATLGSKPEAAGAVETGVLAELDSALGAIVKGTEAAAKEAGAQAQLSADKLVLPPQVPQVNSYGPVYLFSFLPFQTVTIRGRFPPAYPPGQEPALTVDGKTYKAFTYDSQSLSFSLPGDAFAGDGTGGVVWRKADLTIPWDAPRFDSFGRAGVENPVVLGVLPQSAGRLTIEHRIEETRREEVERSTDTFSVDAGAGDVEQTACLTVSPKDRSEGWALKPGSAMLMQVSGPRSGSGWESSLRKSQDADSVCWHMRLRDEGGAPAAEVGSAWKITAVLARETRQPRVETESFDVAWGSSRSFGFVLGSWSLRYAKFGGAPKVLDGAGRASPFIKVESDSRGVKVSAFPF